MSGFLINPYRFGPAYDTDAQAYITAVEAADGQALETGVKDAINAFVVGCKADGIWTAIKACCILAGARTLAGALVPLVGTAPTNYNFASGDYNRETGLVGNGSSKYLDSNRNNNVDPQNSKHLALYVHTAGTPSNSTQVYATNLFVTSQGLTSLGIFSSAQFTRNNCNDATTIGSSTATGFCGTSRSQSASYVHRLSGADNTVTQASTTRASGNIFIYRDPNTTDPFYTNARISFYSIGESLTLSLLDSRVSTLLTAYAAAIP
jgi:hypothetical protein